MRLSTPVRGKNRGKGDLLPRKKMRFGAFYHGSRRPRRGRLGAELEVFKEWMAC